MRLINNNNCLSKLKYSQNIFHSNVVNDLNTFYLDGGGGFVLPMQKVRVFCPGGFCPEGVLSKGVLSYIR